MGFGNSLDQSAGGTAAKIIPLNNEEVKCKLEKVDKDSNGLSRDVRTPGLGIYKIHNVKKNWTLAKEVCEHEGSHLMIINSEREVQSLDNLIENNNNSCDNKIFWIGIHDQYLEGEYITIFNETLESIGFSSWYPGDPDGSTNYNCGYYRYESTYKKGLRDGRCSSHLCFICEK
ncbi:hypothetical protein C0J52_14726 [Blattella germanica]|nr:hypothetical protein C0J52_14726 [Blattella germanica]